MTRRLITPIGDKDPGAAQVKRRGDFPTIAAPGVAMSAWVTSVVSDAGSRPEGQAVA
jgi:hypothetical protein